MLNTLKMCNWIIHLDDATRTMKTISKALRNSPLSHVKIDGISVLDRSKKTRIEPAFFHVLLSSLNSLRWFGCSLGMHSDSIILSSFISFIFVTTYKYLHGRMFSSVLILSSAGKKDEQITAIGNAVLDIRGNEIDIR